MRLLLDTCTFLWLVEDSPRLSPRAREEFARSDRDVYLSAVSAWEVALKNRLGRLPLPARPDVFVPEQRKALGVEPLAVEEEAALQAAALPELHRDPFDRLLVSQAAVHGLTLLTPDDAIRQYAVRTLW